ncbi:MAG TPA: hypothetical protein VFO25_13870 [Candidatus Eremiobacteraceae bacterium]|nr:hypothetical protein [Candidatus Eremiobacteraceae bacterium]
MDAASTNDRLAQDDVLSDVDAHGHAMEIPIQAVVSELIDRLGAPLVAVIGGVRETRAVLQWTNSRTPQRPNVLRFALQLATMIAGMSDVEMARAWFEGSNPQLDDAVPALILRDHPLAEIQANLMAAARSFALRGSPKAS